MKVLVVEDDQFQQDALKLWLSRIHKSKVLCVSDTTAVFHLIPTWQPDLIILDLIIRDPDTHFMDHQNPLGVTAAELLHQFHPTLNILIFSAHYQYYPHMQHLFQRQTGGFGYVLKGALRSKMREAVQAVSQGGTYLDPDITHQFALRGNVPTAVYSPAMVQKIQQAAQNYHLLSPAEKDVVSAIAHGLTSQQIALARGTKDKTINQQASNAQQTLNLPEGDIRVLLALVYWYMYYLGGDLANHNHTDDANNP
jgi:DNA-binding NarL/FixJ family response regulator